MIEAIQMAALGGGQQGNSVQGMIGAIIQQLSAQLRANMVASASTSQALTGELIEEQINTVKFSAERAIANAQSERLMSKLADRFNLISSMQRNLG